jgi:hypothetical protein
MKQIGNGIYELSKSEYGKLKQKAVLEQNNNANNHFRGYFILKTKNGTMDMISYDLSLWAGSKPSYILYRNVNSRQIQEISGIPLGSFISR